MKRSPSETSLLRSRRGFPRTAALLAVIAVFTTACVGAGDPGVRVNKVEANLVFGVEEEEKPVKTPAQALEDFVDIGPIDLGGFDSDFPPIEGFDDPPVVKLECPEAGPTAFAEVPTEVTITGAPPVGLYRWKRTGVRPGPDGPEQLSGYERRAIRKVTKVSDTVYTYEMVLVPPGGETYIVQTYKVNTAPTTGPRSVQLPITAGPVPGFIELPIVVGEPERGIVLMRTQEFNRQNQPVGFAFEPATGLLLLPLPVTSSEQYQSVAVDPKSGRAMVRTAQVVRRQRIDACGEVTDGWLVEGELRDSASPSPDPVQYSYIVATQYGGTIISETYKLADGSQYTFQLAQLEPDPLPEGF